MAICKGRREWTSYVARVLLAPRVAAWKVCPWVAEAQLQGRFGEAKRNAYDGLVDVKLQGARDAHDKARCCNPEPPHVAYVVLTPALRWRTRRLLCLGPVQQA